jgi:hypothetical protein
VWFIPAVHWNLHGATQPTPSTVTDRPGGDVVIVCNGGPPPAFTTSVTEVDTLAPPLTAPVTMKGFVPLAFEGVVTVKVDVPCVTTLVGLKLAPHPAGRPDALSPIVPENPLNEFTVTE